MRGSNRRSLYSVPRRPLIRERRIGGCRLLRPLRSYKEALALDRFRYRLARWLVGPFVNIPEQDGVWIIARVEGGTGTMILHTERFRLKSTTNLRALDYPRKSFSIEDFDRSRTFTRFVGTVAR